jgi:undecaprenyl-diphosphatase
MNMLAGIDQHLFLILNGLHSPFFDTVMFWATKPVAWTPFFILLIVLVIRVYRWKILWVLLFTAAVVTVSDQLARLAKYSAERPRPTHEIALQAQVHTVNGYTGGQFGFYSGHASSTFAVAIFLSLILRRRYRWIPPVVLAWAAIMSYSRIYLGVHYPGDILAGMAVGLLLGWLAGILFIRRIPAETK